MGHDGVPIRKEGREGVYGLLGLEGALRPTIASRITAPLGFPVGLEACAPRDDSQAVPGIAQPFFEARGLGSCSAEKRYDRTLVREA